MHYRIAEVAHLAGVSVRTLHYYDQIALLRPSRTDANGYRAYSHEELARLYQIRMLRELDFDCKTIACILDAPHFDREEALGRQRALLALRRDRLSRLIASIDAQLKEGGNTMDFDAFDTSELDAQQRRYQQEVQQRWGQTDAYRQSAAKAARYTKADWQRIKEAQDALFARFAALRKGDPAALEAQQLTAQWQQHIATYYYDCPIEMLAQLGEMYVGDARFARNLDRYGAGTAAFMRDCIRQYCRK
nr:MerR family transcriptional regulator [Maliibacterium massiliense]